MGLYEDWLKNAEAERSDDERKAYWDAYFAQETEVYKTLLQNHGRVYEGKLAELAKEFSMDDTTFAGFLDGINTSLTEEIKLEELTAESDVKLTVDFEKLYYNMHKAKAPWLYELPEWDAVLSDEIRKDITKKYRTESTYIAPQHVGRNDPCPCGSGKKYKKCCGKDQ